MKRSSQVVTILGLLVFSGFFAANVSAQSAPVAGVYQNFTIGKQSGDLVGMRVAIIRAADNFYAMVQIAQGGAEEPKPVFVEATVKGNRVEFTVGDQKYVGTVTVAGLRVEGGGKGKDPTKGDVLIVKNAIRSSELARIKCSTLFPN